MGTQITTHPVRATRRAWRRAIVVASLVVAGVVGGRALVDRTDGTSEPVSLSPPTAIDHLRRADSAQPEAGTIAEAVLGSGFEDAAFGPAAVEIAWSAIRYSADPGLALILSSLYPLT